MNSAGKAPADLYLGYIMIAKCPTCGKTYTLKDENAGKTAKCAACGAKFTIQAEQIAAPESRETKVPVLAEQTNLPDGSVRPHPSAPEPQVQSASSEAAAPSAQAAVVSFSCPTCSNVVKTAVVNAGKAGKCSGCGSMLQIPQPGASQSQSMHSAAIPTSGSQPSVPPTSAAASIPGLRFLLTGGLILALIGVFCPWYSVSSSANSVFGNASFAVSTSGWWTIPGILVGVVALPGAVLGLFKHKILMLIASAGGLAIVLLGVWGIFYAPSTTPSVDFGGYGTSHGRAGFDWGVFVTIAGGVLSSITGIALICGVARVASLYRQVGAKNRALVSRIIAIGIAAILVIIVSAVAWRVLSSGSSSSPAIGLPAQVGQSKPSVEGFKNKIKWNGAAVTFTKDEFFKVVGQPKRTQELGDDIYFYYSCSDGELQLIVNKVTYELGATVLITGINRY